MNEDWQVVLDDIYAAPRLDQFEVQLDLDTNDKSFNFEMEFEDYGDGREVNLEIEYDPAVRFETSISASEDLRLLGGVNLRVRHNAASRDLLFEYQADGSSVWSELARFNLGSGTFTDIDGNVSSSNSGEVLRTSERMSVEIVAQDVRVATQIGDLEIAGIEIGSFTPPQEARWEPAGWVYYAWPYAYDFTEGRWHFFNQSDKQWRVNLSDSEWATLDAVTGWNYYAWPYSYSSDQGAWHWYNANIQWVVDLVYGDWELFGGSD
jgi:hypothetical protein